jgi:alpha-glucoside transport system permease protein
MQLADKLGAMVLALLAFTVVIGLILFVVSLLEKRGVKRVAWFFVGPTFLLLLLGLVYPAVRTIARSFFDAAGKAFIGVDNYTAIFTSPDQLVVLRNTVLWVLVAPVVATVVGLVYAIIVDGARGEALAKSLIFLPIAISFVGASIIWKFVYEYRFYDPTLKVNPQQIGLLNQIIVWLGGSPQQFLINQPWNNLFLIVVMIWIQAGFAMTILSAAIKAIPQDMVEAARLDGVSSWGMFRFITIPTIRPTLVVVLTTIAIGSLKVFDIVRTMTGGQFGTSVVANEFFTQSFSAGNQGLGAALAVLLFILVIPIIVYNIRQIRRSEAR